MIRLNDMILCLKENTSNKFIFKKGKPEDFVDKKLKITQEDIANEAIENFATVNNYLAFINKIKELTEHQYPSTYIVAEENDNIYIYKSQGFADEFTLECGYTPENTKLLEFSKKLFRLDSNKNYSVIMSGPNNNYSLVVTWQILKVLYAKYNILSKNEELFHQFKLKAKSGKLRDIVAPHEEIKSALQELNTLLQKVYDKRNADFQVAYKKGKSVKSGAEIHTENKYVFNLDLHHFYQSCKRELVKRYTDFLFAFSFNRKFIEDEFLDAILIDDGLFIGSPISGTLANAIISNPVKYMQNMCKQYGMKISVYADDISFSSKRFIAKDFVIGLFDTAFAKYQLDSYFKLNKEKSIGFTGCNRKVTGVVINDSNKITVPKRYYRTLRVMIHHLSQGDTSINLMDLRGKVAYATMLDESGKIYRYLDKYKDTVQKYRLCSDEKMEELKERCGL